VGTQGAIVVPANRGIGGSEPWFRINHQGTILLGSVKWCPQGVEPSERCPTTGFRAMLAT
jgi:hypothetical protein